MTPIGHEQTPNAIEMNLLIFKSILVPLIYFESKVRIKAKRNPTKRDDQYLESNNRYYNPEE
jgi:hypothetical protein